MYISVVAPPTLPASTLQLLAEPHLLALLCPNRPQPHSLDCWTTPARGVHKRINNDDTAWHRAVDCLHEARAAVAAALHLVAELAADGGLLEQVHLPRGTCGAGGAGGRG